MALTSIRSTNSRSPSALRTPCPRLRTPSSQTRTTSSCAGRRSARGHSASTTPSCCQNRCASTTHLSTPTPQVRRTMSTASGMGVHRMRVVGLGSSGLFSFGSVYPILGCVVCSLGTRDDFCHKWALTWIGWTTVTGWRGKSRWYANVELLGGRMSLSDALELLFPNV